MDLQTSDKEKNLTGSKIKSLMDGLASNDGMIRQKARKSLVALGKPAVASLTKALLSSQVNYIRWEAAKALDAIGDSKAIPSLVKALKDSDSDVAWIVAEALKKYKNNAWLPLLQLLVKSGADSVELRQRAHHVLSNQEANGFSDLFKTLMDTLESGSVPELTTIAANEIIKRMRKNHERSRK